MSGIKKLVDATASALKEAQAAQTEAERAAKKKQAALDALREEIKAGGTTGDRVKDWLIVTQRNGSEKTEAFFRDLVDRVDRCQGEFVLVVSRREEPTKHTMFPEPLSPHDYAVRTQYLLGILHGELNLNFVDGGWTFPTGTHARYLEGYRGDVQLREKDLWFMNSAFVEHVLGRRLETRSPFHSEDNLKELEIFIGNEEVGAWLKKPADHNEEVALTLMEKDPEVARKNPQWARRKHVEIFLKLLQCGGWDMPAIPILQEMHHKACVDARTEIMAALKKRDELHRRIEMCDSSRDVKALHKELREAITSIVRSLKKLHELGSETRLYAKLRGQFDVEV